MSDGSSRSVPDEPKKKRRPFKRRKNPTTRREGATREYQSWWHMVRRCYNPVDKNYARYGGRGITVCERWRDSYDAFLADMGRCPPSKYSIDRINNNGNYEPGNCRWADVIEQLANRSTSRLLNVGGFVAMLPEWARRIGISVRTIQHRWDRGWRGIKLLDPPDTRFRSSQLGVTTGLKAAGLTHQHNRRTLRVTSGVRSGGTNPGNHSRNLLVVRG